MRRLVLQETPKLLLLALELIKQTFVVPALSNSLTVGLSTRNINANAVKFSEWSQLRTRYVFNAVMGLSGRTQLLNYK